MQLGIVVMPTDPWPVAVQRARRLEAMGFAHYWLYDHLSWRHYRDRAWHATVPWLAGVAARTERIRLGTMVATPNLRHPLTMAKDAMTLDHVSNGRFILGLGAGGTGFDATVFGHEPLSAGQRADRLVEYVDLLDRLLRGRGRNHDGRWYTIDEGRVVPGCVQQPRLPLAVAAGSPRTIELAAERADIWITQGSPTQPPDDFDAHFGTIERQLARLGERCVQLGRDPAGLATLHLISSANRAPMSSFEAFVETAERSRALGFDHVVVHDRRTDDPALDFPPDIIDRIAHWAVEQAYSADG